jgi:hypothetical protein
LQRSAVGCNGQPSVATVSRRLQRSAVGCNGCAASAERQLYLGLSNHTALLPFDCSGGLPTEGLAALERLVQAGDVRVVSFLLSCGARRDATLKLSVSAMRSNAGGSGAFHAAAQVSACAQPTPSVLSPTSEWMRTAVLTWCVKCRWDRPRLSWRSQRMTTAPHCFGTRSMHPARRCCTRRRNVAASAASRHSSH